MTLTRDEIYTLIQQLNAILKGLHCIDLIELGPYQWMLTLEKQHLLLCFHAPFLRFHLLRHPLKGHDTPFTHKLSSYLQGASVKQVDWVNQDRIVSLIFQHPKGCYHLVGEFFPKRPNLYLLDSQMHILVSLHPTEHNVYAPPDNPKYGEKVHMVDDLDQASMEQKYALLEKEWAFRNTLHKIQNQLTQQLKHAQKSKQKLIHTLEQSLQWPQIHHEGLLLQANLYNMYKGLAEIVVLDWNEDNREKQIILDPKLSPKDEVARRFKQSKKLKAGVEYTQKTIDKIDFEIKRIQDKMAAADKIETLEVLQHFARKEDIQLEKETPAKHAEKELPYHEFMTEKGLKVWVGKNARANEVLTFSYAKGSDYWLHVSDYPGSHVILRVGKGQEPDPESIQDAIQLAIGYSKAKTQGAADVCLTQCKYVSRLGKHSTGKVQVSKHKNIHAKFDPSRFQAIKNQKF